MSELADQTNRLALNAALEAARAVEHGQGFAERTDTLVRDIQHATYATVRATKERAKTVEEGAHLTYRTAEVCDGVAASITNVFESSQHTSRDVKQQLAAVPQVVEAMVAIDNRAKETASSIGHP